MTSAKTTEMDTRALDERLLPMKGSCGSGVGGPGSDSLLWGGKGPGVAGFFAVDVRRRSRGAPPARRPDETRGK